MINTMPSKGLAMLKKNQFRTFLACELCTEGTRAVQFKYISTTYENNLYVNDSMSRPPCAIFYIALSYLEVYFIQGKKSCPTYNNTFGIIGFSELIYLL
jgi:hypothetical protein